MRTLKFMGLMALMSATPAFAQESATAFPQAKHAVKHEMGGQNFWKVTADRLEWQSNNGDEVFAWEGSAWYGGDYNRLWLETEGEALIDGETESADLSLLYGRAVSPFFDIRAGVRRDFEPDSKTYAQLGVIGLAPYWFEIDANAYLSEDGDFTASLEAEYDLLLTQRLVLQPRIETGFAFQDAPERGLGGGFTDIEAGLRLRYEIKREIAPYIGVSWSRPLGETSSIASSLGEKENNVSAVIGIRLWY